MISILLADHRQTFSQSLTVLLNLETDVVRIKTVK